MQLYILASFFSKMANKKEMFLFFITMGTGLHLEC